MRRAASPFPLLPLPNFSAADQARYYGRASAFTEILRAMAARYSRADSSESVALTSQQIAAAIGMTPRQASGYLRTMTRAGLVDPMRYEGDLLYWLGEPGWWVALMLGLADVSRD